ncbi:FlgB family protein [Loktanella sp. M215]|uniref:FlgB family protein n=1 Tax=Loktanella sp. M215 TaxID=2675431 RepID=UPI001F365107|nr:FlgB family protein [Loktanella sp. M215]MCF7698849.1 FlgB family protein [Loktanella sp. M215]
MFQSLALFRTSAAMAQYAGDAQAQIARNIANADTPGYHAEKLTDFAATLHRTGPIQMKATRPGHLIASPTVDAVRHVDSGGEAAPNGNTVSLEDELMQSVAAGGMHKEALAIYRHTMTVLRSSLGR